MTPIERFRRDESGASLFGSCQLDTPDARTDSKEDAAAPDEDNGFPVDEALIAAFRDDTYVYDPKLRPYVCCQLESGVDISQAIGTTEGCRAYRMSPANRFLW
jgi:hypothetical protein